ncbi:Uncharacterised protein [Mycobacteroides abscessus subsp. abscessus]|nr:Uncharacterised protein [Mycobacteroides abscessus subsp. abscessus]
MACTQDSAPVLDELYHSSMGLFRSKWASSSSLLASSTCSSQSLPHAPLRYP